MTHPEHNSVCIYLYIYFLSTFVYISYVYIFIPYFQTCMSSHVKHNFVISHQVLFANWQNLSFHHYNYFIRPINKIFFDSVFSYQNLCLHFQSFSQYTLKYLMYRFSYPIKFASKSSERNDLQIFCFVLVAIGFFANDYAFLAFYPFLVQSMSNVSCDILLDGSCILYCKLCECLIVVTIFTYIFQLWASHLSFRCKVPETTLPNVTIFCFKRW